MDFLREFLQVIEWKMEIPQLFGWYHILCLMITIVLTVLLCKFGKKKSKDKILNLVLGTAIVVIVLEIYKQIVFNIDVTEDAIVWNYQWFVFPWQFCSTPMYVGLFAGLFRKGRLHESLCAYLATYAVFAGACVMIYPSDVYLDVIGINIQTMICHGSMILIGVYLLASGYVKLEHKTILKAVPVFSVAVFIAVIMNEIAYQAGIMETQVFNMFFISPYCTPTLPVYSLVQAVVPFPASLIIYIVFFTLAAYIVLLLAMGVKRLFVLRKDVS